jgi:hypothetical protein
MTYSDKNGIPLNNRDIINIHQTVNGENRFIILNLEDKDVRYFRNPTLKYEYDVDQLLAPCIFSFEPSFTIEGKYTEEINEIVDSEIETYTGYVLGVCTYQEEISIEKITLASTDEEFDEDFDNFNEYVNYVMDDKVQELEQSFYQGIRLTEKEFTYIQNFKR